MGGTKCSNRKLKVKVSHDQGREAPENQGRNPSQNREAYENWGRSLNRGHKKKQRTGSGEGLGEPLPGKVLKNQIWNNSFWCIFETCKHLKWMTTCVVRDHVRFDTFMKNRYWIYDFRKFFILIWLIRFLGRLKDGVSLLLCTHIEKLLLMLIWILLKNGQ